MPSLWKRQRDRIMRVREMLTADVFARAHAKILTSYILIGVVITLISGYLIHYNTISLAQNIVETVQQLLQNHATANQTTISRAIIQIINAEIWQVNLAIGLSMFALLTLYAYVLARLTLWPIQETMERQRRFAANVAHEIRTPLSVMKTNFEVALMGADHTSKEEFQDALRSGIEEVDRISAIAQFLLNFSSFDGRHLELKFSDVDIAFAVNETLRLMKPLISRRDIEVRALCPNPIFIRGNTTALNEMFLNLIQNAIAYTPAHGSVFISTTLNHGRPTLTVSDTGIGIPATDLPNIFEPFYRGGNTYTQHGKKHGSGLGLAIVKEIATLHKAHISVKSEIGKGTAISVIFPAPRRR